MSSDLKNSSLLLGWSRHIPSDQVQDPLGLNLRGLARLADQLLFCITSITPRARYYSFLPWCVYDWKLREQGQANASSLRDGITFRERGFVLSCVAHHEGKPCEGGGLVGTTEAQNWFRSNNSTAEISNLQLTQNQAFDAYFNSLVNLGFFKTDEERSVTAGDDAKSDVMTFDDLELTTLGLNIAEGYDTVVRDLDAIERTAIPPRRAPVKDLRNWGEVGGLCELSLPDAADRETLKDVFFTRVPLPGESHRLRRQSLLLLLELSRNTKSVGVTLNERRFQSAVYFGDFESGDAIRTDFEFPAALQDIATRWRMFYFHHYVGVALEGLFSWIATNAFERGKSGITFKKATDRLSDAHVKAIMEELFGTSLNTPFGETFPIDYLQHITGSSELNAETATQLDANCRPDKVYSEIQLEQQIRSMEHLYTGVGIALPMLLLTLTLARYVRWETTKFDKWLANASTDPYVDIVPPVLTEYLRRKFGLWWNTRWADLTKYVLHRFVLQQHQIMAHEKINFGERCILESDGARILSNSEYRWIGLGNPRFHSAVQILTDLAFLQNQADVGTVLSPRGEAFLDAELLREQKP